MMNKYPQCRNYICMSLENATLLFDTFTIIRSIVLGYNVCIFIGHIFRYESIQFTNNK